MTLRPTQSSTFRLVQSGLQFNLSKLVRAQEQIASGKRILRPSDDPVGSSQAGVFRRQLASQDRFRDVIQTSRRLVDSGAVALEDASGVVSEARAIAIEGMNGTKTSTERRLLADQLRLIRDRMIDIANTRSGERFLFGGTSTQEKPYESLTLDGRRTVAYSGNDQEQRVLVGQDTRVGVLVPGSEVFDRVEHTGSRYAGLTGLAPGTSQDQGVGYDYVEVRHDATTGTLGAGLAFVAGGSSDTVIGDHTLVVDDVAGTVRLDNGPARPIPSPTDADVADFVVVSDGGSELHLDFSGYTGAPVNTTVTGDGSVSIDGVNYVPLDFVDTNLALTDPVTESVVHVDTTGVHRAGRDLLTFGGTVSVFDTLEGMIEDLENDDGLSATELIDRMGERLVELDRNHENILVGLGNLGARSNRLSSLETRLADADVEVRSLLSEVEDADLAKVVLELGRAQSTLETAQAAGVRLLQSTLLNFIR